MPFLQMSTNANTVHIAILSRSHAGKVHDVAKAAFGENVQITPAGGAGFKVSPLT